MAKEKVHPIMDPMDANANGIDMVITTARTDWSLVFAVFVVTTDGHQPFWLFSLEKRRRLLVDEFLASNKKAKEAGRKDVQHKSYR